MSGQRRPRTISADDDGCRCARERWQRATSETRVLGDDQRAAGDEGLESEQEGGE